MREQNGLTIKINLRYLLIKLPWNYPLIFFSIIVFFNFGNLHFQQVIGIPIGFDPAPFRANPSLWYYEDIWLLHTKKRDLHKACLFSNTFCFIGNLCTINNNLEFDRNFKNIYPSELSSKSKTFKLPKHHFLYLFIIALSIIIENKKFKTHLCDMRDAFPFSIVYMPHLDYKIPSNIYYASIGSEILRLPRTTSLLRT